MMHIHISYSDKMHYGITYNFSKILIQVCDGDAEARIPLTLTEAQEFKILLEEKIKEFQEFSEQ